MRLNDLINLIKEKADEENPVIKVVVPHHQGGFVELDEDTFAILNRNEYYDDSAFGNELPKDPCVVLDFCI